MTPQDKANSKQLSKILGTTLSALAVFMVYGITLMFKGIYLLYKMMFVIVYKQVKRFKEKHSGESK